MRVQDQDVTFNAFKVMQLPDTAEVWSFIDVVDRLVDKAAHKVFPEDPLEAAIMAAANRDDE